MTTMATPHKPEPAVWNTIRSFQSSAPVDVVALAGALGLQVWEDELPTDISGKIFRDPEHGGTAQYSIVINSTETLTKKRFTVGHEIGHFLLHREQIGDGLTDDALYHSGLSTLAEVQANRIAGEILMPFALIEQLTAAGIKTLDEIADKLEVSRQALAARLQVAE